MFSTTGEYVWLRYLGANFAHHNSALRDFVHLATIPIVHQMDFTYFLPAYEQIQESLINGYGGADGGVILFAASNTPNDVKKEKLGQWKELKDVAPQCRIFLDSIGKKPYYENPFSAYLLEWNFFLMLEVAATNPINSKQLAFIDIPTVRGTRGFEENRNANPPKMSDQLILSGIPAAVEKGDPVGKLRLNDSLTIEQVMKRIEACPLSHPFVKILPD